MIFVAINMKRVAFNISDKKSDISHVDGNRVKLISIIFKVFRN